MLRFRTLFMAMLVSFGATPGSWAATADTRSASNVAAMAPATAGPGRRAAAAAEPPVAKMTAAQIVERHIAARGGASVWRSVQAMQLTGRMEAGTGDSVARAQKLINASAKGSGKATNAEVAAANLDLQADKQVQLPFTLDLQRPKRMRLEIAFNGKTAVQVFDGKQGWKVRPFLNRTDVEPFTTDEASTEASRGDLDGPLIDYAVRGTKVVLEGSDLVDEQPAYRLKLTPRNGAARHVWIDAKSFLDVKVEGFARRMDGKMHAVYVYQRDFRAVQGVKIPFVQETAVEGYEQTHALTIEKAVINPTFDGDVFSKPHA